MADVDEVTVTFEHVDVGAAVVVPPVGCAIENATYVSSFSVATQDGFPVGVTFSGDGTKMFVMGSNSDSVYRYDLSVAWDITSASYISFKDVSAQDTNPRDVTFSPDGTKMFVVSEINDSVYRYDLSIPWDITTAVFPNIKDVYAQDTRPLGVTFSGDGTKMFVMGETSASVYRYDLTVAWNITTASYVSLKDVSAQETFPTGVTFSGDGTKMFVVGGDNDSVYRYDLSAAWDITSASYVSLKDVWEQEVYPYGVTFSGDGTKMFVVGPANDSVYRYDLTVAWNITTASYVSTKDVSAQDTSPVGVTFSGDGTIMFVAGDANASIYRYDLTVAWDITTASYVSTKDAGAQGTVPYGIEFSGDGTKMFVVGEINDSVYRYDLSIPWDITTAVFPNIKDVSAQDTSPYGVTFSGDGTKMFVMGSNSDSVYRYDLSVAWDITSASYISFKDVSAQETSPLGFTLSGDGTKMFVVGYDSGSAHRYDLSIVWDITTATYVSLKDVSAQETIPQSITFSSDCTIMFVVGTGNDSVYRYDL